MNKTEDNRKKNKEKVLRFQDKMRKSGYIWLCRWVPKKFKDKVDKFIKDLVG